MPSALHLPDLFQMLGKLCAAQFPFDQQDGCQILDEIAVCGHDGARLRVTGLQDVIQLVAHPRLALTQEGWRGGVPDQATVAEAPFHLHLRGKPMQNGFVESFNGRMRDELLNETMFRNLAHARVVIAAWTADYNTERPHSALDYQTPADYARTLTTAIARPAARNESSARRAIAQPAPIGVNTTRTPVAAG